MNIHKLVAIADKKRASDLHLVLASPPLLRIDGALEPVENSALLTTEEITEAFVQITTAAERKVFNKYKEIDFGYTMPDIGRLRCNAAQQRGSISLAIRLLPPIILSISELELPDIYKKIALEHKGLVVISGPTDSGKTTTIASMIQYINTLESRHIVTIEDPIEYVYTNLKSAISQRELGRDTLSFANALKHILRQSPDVIVVGEMRDLETAAAVLTIAETGHLVLTTGHAPSAHQAIERVIDLFPHDERHLAQTRLASLLIAVFCQTLVSRAGGSGRIAAVEIMLASPSVRSLIREGKIYQLPNIIRTNHDIGMISYDESLVNLYKRGAIELKTLYATCNSHKEVEKLLDLATKENKKLENETGIAI